ncbi:MAG: hypothetical protein CBB71_09610 [Rhodopirellula sp. TMED11]|nr:MAG: hypothetical protein CBB71_09610 [Rhodopirellula sp. TMED11]
MRPIHQCAPFTNAHPLTKNAPFTNAHPLTKNAPKWTEPFDSPDRQRHPTGLWRNRSEAGQNSKTIFYTFAPQALPRSIFSG